MGSFHLNYSCSLYVFIDKWLLDKFRPHNLDIPTDAIWSGYFGIFYRKFFFDFVGGTLRDPGGMQCVLKTNLGLDKVFANHPSELPRALLSSLPS